MGNTVIGIPIIFILDKLNRLTYLNIMRCLLFLALVFVIKDGRLFSFNIFSLDSAKYLLWKYLSVLYFSICVATIDYLMVKNKQQEGMIYVVLIKFFDKCDCCELNIRFTVYIVGSIKIKLTPILIFL